MIKLLGRQTSGNVQKVNLLPGRTRLALCPRGLRPPIRQHADRGIPQAQPHGEGSDLDRRRPRDLGIPYHPSLSRRRAWAGADRSERGRAHHGRALDGLFARRLEHAVCSVFKDVKKAPAERAGDFAAQSADLLAQLKILDGHIAGRQWFALDRFTIADIALGSIVKRCLEFPIERPAYSELERWQAAINARPAFAVAIGTKPSVLTSAA